MNTFTDLLYKKVVAQTLFASNTIIDLNNANQTHHANSPWKNHYIINIDCMAPLHAVKAHLSDDLYNALIEVNNDIQLLTKGAL